MKKHHIVGAVLAAALVSGSASAFTIDTSKIYMTLPSSYYCSSGSCGRLALTATCGSGQVVIGGACTTSTGFAGFVSEAGAHNGNSWLCNYNSSQGGVTYYAYAYCATP